MKRPENEQAYGYVQQNPPYAPPPQYDNQNATGQPAYKLEGGGNSSGQPLVININSVADHPCSKVSQKLFCKICQQERMTRTEFKSGCGALICSGILFIFGLWPFCILPFCLDKCKTCRHYCSVCGTYLGKVKYLT